MRQSSFSLPHGPRPFARRKALDGWFEQRKQKPGTERQQRKILVRRCPTKAVVKRCAQTFSYSNRSSLRGRLPPTHERERDVAALSALSLILWHKLLLDGDMTVIGPFLQQSGIRLAMPAYLTNAIMNTGHRKRFSPVHHAIMHRHQIDGPLGDWNMIGMSYFAALTLLKHLKQCIYLLRRSSIIDQNSFLLRDNYRLIPKFGSDSI